jgi:hypothetical protein
MKALTTIKYKYIRDYQFRLSVEGDAYKLRKKVLMGEEGLYIRCRVMILGIINNTLKYN